MDQPIQSLSIEQTESLILSLYQPNQPDAIAATQATLTQLHRSPQAWSIARDLLSRADEKVKFHGALIIIIKLNTESSSLGEDDAKELLFNLLRWYLESFTQGSSLLVSRKLSSALATFLIHFHRLWRNYVRHLLLCLASQQVHDISAIDESANLGELMGGLSPVQTRAALWVIINVMEDASRVDLNAEKNIELYGIVQQNTGDAVALMERAFSSQSLASELQEDATKCLQAWIWFTQKSSRDKFLADSLRSLITVVINLLPLENTADSAIELVTDILSNYSSLLTEEHYDLVADLLTSSWSQTRYQALIAGDFDFESMQYGQLLLAFGDARVDSLMRIEDDRSRNILSCLCGLLSADGYPAVDDKIFAPALEFWSTYTETVTDEVYSREDSSSPWSTASVSFVLQAVSNAWQKIAFPPAEQYSQWEPSDRVGFSDARKDVADLLQSTFALSGPQLIFTFADLVLSALSNSTWLQLEAAAYCLGAMADCIKDDTRCDDALNSVFSSSLFSALREGHSQIPTRARQTCVSLIEHYTDFFVRHIDHLPAALSLLFVLLGDHILVAPASKSIQQLCSSCRHHLHQEIGAFLDEYRNLTLSRKVDCISCEKVLGGIACVAQAVTEEAQKLAAFDRILRFVEEDLQCALELINSTVTPTLPCPPGSRCRADTEDEHPALHVALRVVKSLASIGRGFQSLVDTQVDVDGENQTIRKTNSEMAALQRRVFGITVKVQETFGTSAEITETACSIFRYGFSETEPGPFVFSPADVTQFLTRHSSDSPRIGALIKTACSFVSSLRQLEPWKQQQYLSAVLLWVIGLCKQLPEPEADPELTQNAIDFVCRVITKSPLTLIQLQPPDAGEFLFLFTIKVLDGKEPLPKAAAAEFWVNFATLGDDLAGLREASRQAMDTLGPLVCQSLARNIGGNALRSELDKLSEPLKKLVVRYPQTKMWLESGLEHPSFPSSKINREQKSIFVKKIISLRGARGTNQVVREFWLAARGSSFAYAS